MTRLIIIIFALFFLGFSKTNRLDIDFLFYNLPLDKSIHIIKNKMLLDKNFIMTGSEKSFFYIRHVEAKIDKPNTYIEFADSADININLLSWFYYRNKSKEDPMLKKLELTFYFKNNDLKNAEFDTLEKVLSKDYKLKSIISSTVSSYIPNRGHDTIPENGKIFKISGDKKYPEIEIAKSVHDKNKYYIKLIYTGVN
ncbi:MAG: hypothetical protein JST26_07180 [Bacteroidetes bacterium]|nr:hypothetical protein [Bacteroidota bacterium]